MGVTRFLKSYFLYIQVKSYYVLAVRVTFTLTTVRCHDANFVVTGSTRGCRYDDFRCRQWRQKLAPWQLSGFSFFIRAVSRLASNQWETWFQSNAASHWLGAATRVSPAYGILPYIPNVIFHLRSPSAPVGIVIVPRVRPSVRPEEKHRRSNSLRISGICLQFGGVMHSTKKHIAI